jgi:hypothetical protein
LKQDLEKAQYLGTKVIKVEDEKERVYEEGGTKSLHTYPRCLPIYENSRTGNSYGKCSTASLNTFIPSRRPIAPLPEVYQHGKMSLSVSIETVTFCCIWSFLFDVDMLGAK